MAGAGCGKQQMLLPSERVQLEAGAKEPVAKLYELTQTQASTNQFA
jgi:hypothetical protein